MPFIIVSKFKTSTLYLERVTKEKTIWSPSRSNARRYSKEELPRKLARAKQGFRKWGWKTYSKEV